MNDGNQIEDACYGSDHSLSLKIDAYARATRKYDSRRRIAEERYFDSLNKPSRLAGRGQHITRFSYDSLGKKIAEVYFGIHEEPALGISPDGDDCVRWTAEYDSAKQLIDRKCHRK